MPYLQNKLVSI